MAMAHKGPIRSLLLGLTLALLTSSSVAAPALAASTTPFAARFSEQTSSVPCPAGTPSNFMCFSGQGTGEATPGGRARESFRTIVGPIDPTNPCADDYSVAKITVSSGSLDLVARGRTCFDTGIGSGTWTFVGGDGRFEDARGSGNFRTTVTNPGPPIQSETTYQGTLTF
jgi:hypothetical protein